MNEEKSTSPSLLDVREVAALCSCSAAEEHRNQQNFEACRELYVLQGRRALLLHLLDHGFGTADVVYPAVKLPSGIDPRCLGSVPGVLERAGIIRSAGFVKSARPIRHVSILHVWELTDRQGAIEWLARHREFPDVPSNEPSGSMNAGFSNPNTPPRNDDSRQHPRQRLLPGIESEKG